MVFQYRASNLGAFVVFLSLENEYPQDDRPVEENRPQKGLVREVEAKEIVALAQPMLAARGKEREDQRAKIGARAPDKPVDGAFEVAFGLAARKSPQVEAWGVADDDETVVILYDRMKVVKKWAFKTGTAVSDADIDAIVTDTAKEASTR
ncbi:hypothetical protein [Fimbriiglobus ruber]|uniref:Uncharacterized protein n=1 Tax=Fimbriiglobus ruber TaxID=1908690 RepID=A0A225D5U9_9BACT|nr:hypothetical protein [Fimbriiglobus ruber]OWK35014.1 hypothetical protein FRUB_09856 [Fimbriiglobus ruber]